MAAVVVSFVGLSNKKCVSEERRKKTEGKTVAADGCKLMKDEKPYKIYNMYNCPFYTSNFYLHFIGSNLVIKAREIEINIRFCGSFGRTKTATDIDAADDDEMSVVVVVDRKLC